jgi:hypothetical protein
MRVKVARVVALAATCSFVFAGSAGALTLGTTVAPAGGFFPFLCVPSDVLAQVSDDPSTPFIVPAGGGRITQWSTNTLVDTNGNPLTFVVMRPGSGADTVVAADTESVSTSGITDTFTLPTPITVSGGEILGLYSSDTSNTGPTCAWGAGPNGDSLNAFSAPSPPAAAQSLSIDSTFMGPTPGTFELNLAANLAVTADVGVANAAAPASMTLGNYAVLSSTVADAGPGSDTVTFSDVVPPGLTVVLAEAGSGSCVNSGQFVTCSIGRLSPGQFVPVNIVVKPTTTGTFTNPASVQLAPTGDTDPNSSNNSSSATLTVQSAPVAPTCVVPKLQGQKLAFAKRLLGLLGCKAGSVTHAHSSSVARGKVIKTKPGAGTYAAGRRIALVISSGPKKRKKHATREAALALRPL